MFKKNKEMRLMTLFALALSVVGIVFACLALNVALNAEKTASVWDVNFTNLVVDKEGTASFEAPVLNSTSMSDFKVGLMRNGDSVTYRFRIRNDGAVDARVKVMSDFVPTCVVNDTTLTADPCSEVAYSLTYANGDVVSIGDVVSSGTSKEVLLNIKYFGEAITDLEVYNLDFMLLFEQV